jgi:hypothetical protein
MPQVTRKSARLERGAFEGRGSGDLRDAKAGTHSGGGDLGMRAHSRSKFVRTSRIIVRWVTTVKLEAVGTETDGAERRDLAR